MKYINFAAANAQYYATITFDDAYYGANNIKCVLLDCINDINVNSQSQITQFPLVSGKISADHIIQQPRTVTMSGKFGRNASYSGTNKAVIEETFKNIQRLFERIKNQGYLCTIQKVHREPTDFETFDELKNMVLTSIAWTEQNNTMNFNFTFTEVFLVSVIDAPYDDSDKNAPIYRELQTSNLNEVFYSNERMRQVREVANQIIDTWENEAIEIADVSAQWTAIIGAITTALTGPLGVLATAAGEGIALLAYEDALGDAKEARKAVEKWMADPKSSEAINTAMQQIWSDFNVYTFSEDRAQICYLDYLGIKIKVEKNNVGLTTSIPLTIYNYETGEVISQKSNIKSTNWQFEKSTPLAYINDIGIYVLRTGEYQQSRRGVLTESIDIRDYAIVVTKIKPSEYLSLIQDKLTTAIGLG